MLIQEKALSHWVDNFYGYGSWHARCWFIGYEEGGGDTPEEVADKLNFFYNIHTEHNAAVCDIRELYKHVAIMPDRVKANAFDNLYEYRFGKDAMPYGIWKNLILFVHGYRKLELPELLSYQQHRFLSPLTQSEALISLYPLPSPHNHAWYYSWLDISELHFLRSRALYQEHVYQRRIQCILTNINLYKPEVVLMYGMDNINGLKKSIQDFFKGVKFKMIKATNEEIPQHHMADLAGTTIVITTQMPALKHNRISTGFNWQKFGKSVKL